MCTRKDALCIVFFFNDTATTEIYTLSLHDALPIFPVAVLRRAGAPEAEGLPRADRLPRGDHAGHGGRRPRGRRSEEHTSELQSRQYLVCRLLLEKKKTNSSNPPRLTALRIIDD